MAKGEVGESYCDRLLSLSSRSHRHERLLIGAGRGILPGMFMWGSTYADRPWDLVNLKE